MHRALEVFRVGKIVRGDRLDTGRPQFVWRVLGTDALEAIRELRPHLLAWGRHSLKRMEMWERGEDRGC